MLLEKAENFEVKTLTFIESKDNNLFKETKKLKERKNRTKSNKYIIEGFRLVQEAFKAGLNIECLIVTCDGKDKIDSYLREYINKDIKIYEMVNSLFKEIISTEKPQGIVAIVHMNEKTLDLN